jgi:hypothetical protein
MESRRAPRSSSGYRPARVSFAPGEAAFFCIVHNRSDRGLCIELTFEAEELPSRFEFSFDDFRTTHVCRTVWREDNIAGVAFDTLPPGSPANGRAKLRLIK